MWKTSGAKSVAGIRTGSRVAAACIAASLPLVPASAQAPVTVAHTVTAHVEAVALVREVSVLLPAADSAGILAGSVQVVSTAPFGVEIRAEPATAALTAVRLPGGPWMPLSTDTWLTLAELPNGSHALLVEYRVEALPDGALPSPPTVRAVVR
jgi:hypothetical protein